MFEKVVEIISNYTDVPKKEITENTNMLTDLGLQSIDFIDMICDFEEEFGKVVPERDFRKLTTVRKIIDYIEGK
ncbi:MAG: acyl carrier protein [Eubacterium sp.]|jgi:acyl carrier protein|nr:acyl carrier protein [Eubacterium sp.]